MEEKNRAQRIRKLNYLVRFPLPAVRTLSFNPRPTPTRGGLAIVSEGQVDVQGILQSASNTEEALHGP
eukprot:7990770-Alexandrium_andersonii.AAC.1